ncbi:MAG: chemotaxis protein CheD [Vampirovibrionales bacterium]|nr:chemotaxis protein CheD [Vampirovibrionales bacterium]
MPIQTTEVINLGDVIINDNRTRVFVVNQLASGLLVCVQDKGLNLMGLALIALPDSTLVGDNQDSLPGKYADKAMPQLLMAYENKGGKLNESSVKMVGGAQLFSFGGGGGNILNIGSRNAIAVRASLSKYGLTVEKADIGGNKGRSVKIVAATGQVFVQLLGGREYLL